MRVTVEVCWLPIVTASKDGTEILLYDSENGAYVGCWMTPELRNSEVHSYKRFKDCMEPRFEPKLLLYHGCGECCGDAFPPEPTHWSPFPEVFK